MHRFFSNISGKTFSSACCLTALLFVDDLSPEIGLSLILKIDQEDHNLYLQIHRSVHFLH